MHQSPQVIIFFVCCEKSVCFGEQSLPYLNTSVNLEKIILTADATIVGSGITVVIPALEKAGSHKMAKSCEKPHCTKIY